MKRTVIDKNGNQIGQTIDWQQVDSLGRRIIAELYRDLTHLDGTRDLFDLCIITNRVGRDDWDELCRFAYDPESGSLRLSQPSGTIEISLLNGRSQELASILARFVAEVSIRKTECKQHMTGPGLEFVCEFKERKIEPDSICANPDETMAEHGSVLSNIHRWMDVLMLIASVMLTLGSEAFADTGPITNDAPVTCAAICYCPEVDQVCIIDNLRDRGPDCYTVNDEDTWILLDLTNLDCVIMLDKNLLTKATAGKVGHYNNYCLAFIYEIGIRTIKNGYFDALYADAGICESRNRNLIFKIDGDDVYLQKFLKLYSINTVVMTTKYYWVLTGLSPTDYQSFMNFERMLNREFYRLYLYGKEIYYNERY